MKGSMIAAVLHAPGDMRIEEVPVPQIDDNEVLIRVVEGINEAANNKNILKIIVDIPNQPNNK